MGWGGSPAPTAHWPASVGKTSRRRSRMGGTAWLGVSHSRAIWVAFWEPGGRAPLRSRPVSRLEASLIRRSQESRFHLAGWRCGGPGLPRFASSRLPLSGPRSGGRSVPFSACCRWKNGPRVGLQQKSNEHVLCWIPPERTAVSLWFFGAGFSRRLVLSSIIFVFSVSWLAFGPVSSPTRPAFPARLWPTRPVWFRDRWGLHPRGRSWWP